MLNYTIPFNTLYDLALETYDGIVEISLAKFKSHLEYIMKDLNLLKSDGLSNKLVTPTYIDNLLSKVNFPTDMETLVAITSEQGKDMFETQTTSVVEKDSTYFYVNRNIAYINSKVTAVYLKYRTNILDPELILFPNHSVALQAIAYGILWKYLSKEAALRKVGTAATVNWAHTEYILLKEKLLRELNTIDMKTVHRENIK